MFSTNYEDTLFLRGYGTKLPSLLTFQLLHQTAGILKKNFPELMIEASGGVTEENIKEFFSDNIDVISLGRTTQGYKTVDFSMKIDKPGRQIDNPFMRRYSHNTLVNKLI